MLTARDITTELLAERIAAALKACAANAVDRGIWIERTADALGVDVRTFQGHFYGETAPRLDHFLRYVAHFGPSFAGQILEPAGIACVRAGDVKAIQSGEVLKIARQAATAIKGLGEDLERLSGGDGAA